MFPVLLFSLSCTEANSLARENKEEVWICYNPDSEYHGQLCGELYNQVQGYYERCFWDTESSPTGTPIQNYDSFCWRLPREDCEQIELQWQKDNCHYFND